MRPTQESDVSGVLELETEQKLNAFARLSPAANLIAEEDVAFRGQLSYFLDHID